MRSEGLGACSGKDLLPGIPMLVVQVRGHASLWRSPGGIMEEGDEAFSPPLGVLACPPPAVGLFDGQPAVTLW